MMTWALIYGYAFVSSTVLAAILTALVRRFALRYGILDHPGERKMQTQPVALLGGVAIFGTFYLVIIANFLLVTRVGPFNTDWVAANILDFLGTDVKLKLLGIGAGGLIIFVLGLVDDIVALRPEAKLVGQIVAALVLVASGVRLDLFIPDVLAVNGWSPYITGGVTMVWVIMMMNAMNFLDNMDGLCGGVSVIAAFSFFLCIVPHGEHFICVLLIVFAGSVAGFLFHNFSPARIYMGDAGAMFCGYVLATVAVLGTFYTEYTPSRVAVAAPLLALSVPLFDTLSVVYIRWRNGESIMKGDKRHFSHRLVDLGMSPRQAVEFIYFVAAVAGLGAAVLPQVGLMGTIIILLQTLGLFCLIVVLMNASNGRNGNTTS